MKTLLCCVLLAGAAPALAQPTQPAEALNPPMRKDYLRISHNQRTAARVSLLGGALLTGGVVAYMAPGKVAFDDMPPFLTAAGIGVVSMLGSIPLFIASKRNARKARPALSLSLLQPGAVLCGGNTAPVYPAVAVRLPL